MIASTLISQLEPVRFGGLCGASGGHSQDPTPGRPRAGARRGRPARPHHVRAHRCGAGGAAAPRPQTHPFPGRTPSQVQLPPRTHSLPGRTPSPGALPSRTHPLPRRTPSPEAPPPQEYSLLRRAPSPDPTRRDERWSPAGPPCAPRDSRLLLRDPRALPDPSLQAQALRKVLVLEMDVDRHTCGSSTIYLLYYYYFSCEMYYQSIAHFPISLVLSGQELDILQAWDLVGKVL